MKKLQSLLFTHRDLFCRAYVLGDDFDALHVVPPGRDAVEVLVSPLWTYGINKSAHRYSNLRYLVHEAKLQLWQGREFYLSSAKAPYQTVALDIHLDKPWVIELLESLGKYRLFDPDLYDEVFYEQLFAAYDKTLPQLVDAFSRRLGVKIEDVEKLDQLFKTDEYLRQVLFEAATDTSDGVRIDCERVVREALLDQELRAMISAL